MNFSTSNFAGYVQRYTAAAQAASQAALDFAVGSVVLALGEAVAGVATWLQYLILQLISITRAATSTGSDLDSWMADLNFFRFGGAPSQGTLAPFRATASVQSVIPVGWTVSTVDSSVSAAVIKDTTNPNWSNSLNGYVLAIGVNTINVPAQSTTNGQNTNVSPGTLTQIQTPIVGIDSVNNAAGFTGGMDGWSDAQFRAEFVLYLQALRTSNLAAIDYAVSTTPGVARFKVIECEQWSSLVTLAGSFFVLCDDGTASPPAQLFKNVDAAVNAERGCGIEYQGSHAPSGVTVDINVTVNPSTANTASVTSKIKQYVNGFDLGGGTVALALIAQAALKEQTVTNVELSTITINGVNADLAITPLQVPFPGTINVTAV